MLRFACALIAGCLLGSHLAGATVVAGSYGVTKSGSANVTVTNVMASPFSMNLALNTPVTTDFISLHASEPIGFSSNPLNLDANFTFTLPGATTFTDHGTGSIDMIGIFLDGSLTWADGNTGTNVNFADGAILNINLSNADFDGFFVDNETVEATFTLKQGPTSVPEPASLALLGGALLGLASVRRRRH